MTQAQHPQSVPRPDDDGFRDWATVRMNQLRRRAFLLSGSWYAADDLVQEALIAMYLSWTRIARSGNVDAYANRVLAGKFVDSTRRPWRREQPVDAVPDIADRGAERSLEGVTGVDAELLIALSGLPPAQRVVVVLRFAEDLTVDDIARHLNIPSGTVKSRLSRGTETLRTELARRTPTPVDDVPRTPQQGQA